MEGRSSAEVRQAIGELVQQREDGERSRRRNAHKTVLGLEGLARMAFEQRPRRPERSRRPYCHVSCPRARAGHFRDMSALHEAYADCSERFRAGDRTVVFPPGTYPPPVPVAA